MPNQTERAETFAKLHVKGSPVILWNIWDPGSAAVAARAGARAIATGSWSVAAAFGFADGEKLPLDLALANIRRIVATVDLPVTLDLEGGYGTTPEAVAETVTQVLATGAIGFNFEDQIVGGEGLYPIADQVARIQAMRQAAVRAGVPAFLNARTDLFLKADASRHDEELVDRALERAAAYAAAGASGFFVPGLIDETLIRRVCAESALPVNAMALGGSPSARRLAELGVARISHGPGPYRLAMKALEEAARAALAPIEPRPV